MMAGVAYKSMATSMWKGQKIAAAIVNMEIEEGKDMEGFSPRRYRERHESERWSGLSRRVVAAPWVLASGDEGTTKTGKAGSA